MSGVLIKTGIYGIFRVCVAGLGVPPLAWGGLVLAVGAVSMVLGVLYALMQHDLKRLLAYHSIENIGIILVAAGVGMIALSTGRPALAVLALAASLLHVLNHALFKGLLFLGAGAVVAATGTRQIEHMGGLARRHALDGGFLPPRRDGHLRIAFPERLRQRVARVSVAAARLPHGRADTFVRLAFPIGGALLGLTTALAAACFVKAFGITFLALPRGAGAAEARESGALMLAPQAALGLACVAIGLFPGRSSRCSRASREHWWAPRPGQGRSRTSGESRPRRARSTRYPSRLLRWPSPWHSASQPRSRLARSSPGDPLPRGDAEAS